MSKEKNLEEFELSDDAIESAAGGRLECTDPYDFARFICNNCGGCALFQRQGGVDGYFTHDYCGCGETYYINFRTGITEDSKKQGVANLIMYYD